MKKQSVKLKFTRFTFVGKPEEVESYGEHLVRESRRYVARSDFASVLAINEDLRTIERFRERQTRLRRRTDAERSNTNLTFHLIVNRSTPSC